MMSLLSLFPFAAYGQNADFAVIHAFAGAASYLAPGPLVQDDAGNLYGVVGAGGTTQSGVLFRLAPGTGEYTVLYTFAGVTNGVFPVGVIRDSAGNFYGVTLQGGNPKTCQDVECGVLFAVSSTGVETVLHEFSAPTGSEPLSSLVADTQGNFYGTTNLGGSLNYGVVFQVDGHGDYTVLHDFRGASHDGANPDAGLYRDQAGNLYGTTYGGGAFGYGTIFEFSPDGAFTILHSFDGADGSSPAAPLISDAAGNLYGSTAGGSNNSEGCTVGYLEGCGVLFKLDTARHYTVLYNFAGGLDGNYPSGKMFLDATTGDLYGSTYVGGSTAAACPHGCGTVFKLDPSGAKTILHTFAARTDGGMPYYGLTERAVQSGGSLVLFGTTQVGGTYSNGSAFALTVPQ